jgi:ELWxxDGT repeat protein
VSDGTPAGTVQLKDIYTGTLSGSPNNFVRYNGRVYFAAQDMDASRFVWVTDGTTDGTRRVLASSPGSSMVVEPTFATRGALFVQNDQRLWRWDGQSSRFLNVSPWTGATASLDFSVPVFPLKGGAIYSVRSSSRRTVYFSDGTQENTRLIFSVASSLYSTFPLVVTEQAVYFEVDHSLYKTDGTPGGTVKLGTFTTPPGGARASQNCVYFFADSALWRTDGTVAGTVLIKSFPGGSFASGGVTNGDTYFFGRTSDSSVWRTDGTPDGTQQLATLSVFGTQTKFVMLEDVLYVSTQSSLYRIDPITGNTQSVVAGLSGPVYLQGTSDKLFFRQHDGSSGYQLWVLTNDSIQATQLTFITGPTNGGNPHDLYVIDDRLYFNATTLEYGNELWVSDGSLAGTRLFADLNPSNEIVSSSFYPVVTDQAVYFHKYGAFWKMMRPGQTPEKLVDLNAQISWPAYGNKRLMFFTTSDWAGNELFAVTDPDDAAPEVIRATTSVESHPAVLFELSKKAAGMQLPEGLSVRNLATSVVTSAQSVFFDEGTNRLVFALPTTLPDGNYLTTLAPGMLTDTHGHTQTSEVTLSFFLLATDANRDRKVDTADFNLLASNFGGSSKVFSEGNFNYDANGLVNSEDFNLFIAQYGKSLAPPSASPIAGGTLFGSIGLSDGEDELLD